MNKFFLLLILATLTIVISCNTENNKHEAQRNVKKAKELLEINGNLSRMDTAKQILSDILFYLNKAIELDSTNTEALELKIIALKCKNDKPELVKTMIALMKLKPSFAEGHIALGRLYESQSNASLAIMHYEKAKEILEKMRFSDIRNYNLVFIEYLITKRKDLALNKLQIFPVMDKSLKRGLLLELDELEKGDHE